MFPVIIPSIIFSMISIASSQIYINNTVTVTSHGPYQASLNTQVTLTSFLDIPRRDCTISIHANNVTLPLVYTVPFGGEFLCDRPLYVDVDRTILYNPTCMCLGENLSLYEKLPNP
jgi:hypothetical protein